VVTHSDKVFFENENGVLYNGESLSILKHLPSESINCCVTSPPYYGLRDYGTAEWQGGDISCDHIEKNARNDSGNEFIPGRRELDKIQYKEVCGECGATRVDHQIGLEQTYDDYINNLCDIFDEVKRVLRKDGTCWVNIGDSYATSHETGATDGKNGWKCGELLGEGQKMHGRANGGNIPSKSLMGIPFRFALEMIRRGWILRNTIIWHKPSCMPQSASDRFTVDFEYIFFFVKNKKYWFETQYEPYSQSYLNDLRHQRGVPEHTNLKDYESQGLQVPTQIHDNSFGKLGECRIKRTVWSINTKPFKEAHFATYPTDLIQTPIKAGCPEFVCDRCGKPRERVIKTIPNPERSHEGRTHTTEEHRMGKSPVPEKGWKTEKVDEGWTDCGCDDSQFVGGVVLDPFFGSGTTAIESETQHKRWVGIELNPEYCKIAKRRLQKHSQELELF